MARKKPAKKNKKTFRSSPPNNTMSQLLQKYLPWVILGVSLIIFFTARICFIDIPLNRDEGAYGYIGKIAMRGGVPYKDFYEMKPPGLFYFYGLLGGIFGYGSTGLKIGIMIINLLNGLVMYGIARKLFKHQGTSIITASLFLLLSLSKGVFGHSLIAEQAVLFFSMPSIYFIIGDKTRKNLLLSGAFIALALTIKQSSIFYLMAIVAYLLWNGIQSRKGFKSIITEGVWFFIPIGIIGMLTLLFIKIFGDWDGMIYWLFEHAKNYITSDNNRGGWYFFRFFGLKFISAQWPLLILSLLGLFTLPFMWKKGNTFQILVPLAIFSSIALTPGGRFYSQYWMLLIPVLALIAGCFYFTMWNSYKKLIPIISLVILAFVIIDFYNNSVYYLVNDEKKISEEMYTSNPFYEIKQLTNYLNQIKKPGETLYVLGSEPQAYLYTGLISPTRHIFQGMITSNTPENSIFQQEALNDLERSRPDYVLLNIVPFSWTMGEGDITTLYHDSYAMVTNNYRPIAIADYAPGGSNLVYGTEALNYTPRSGAYVVLYKK